MTDEIHVVSLLQEIVNIFFKRPQIAVAFLDLRIENVSVVFSPLQSDVDGQHVVGRSLHVVGVVSVFRRRKFESGREVALLRQLGLQLRREEGFNGLKTDM